MKINRAAATIAFLALTSSYAATPPGLLNYQGVLRDNNGRPLSGSYSMTFRFIDVNSGLEIMHDIHDDASGGAVTVSGGLFSVRLGSGDVSDGPGPGTYTALDQVFRDHDNVTLRVEVEGETLTPDLRVVAAAYAQNATTLSGLHDSQFLRSDQNDTAVGNLFLAGTPSGSLISSGLLYLSPGSVNPGDTLLGVSVSGMPMFRVSAEGDTKVGGKLTVDGSPAGGYGVEAYGQLAGGRFGDSDQSGYAEVGNGDYGIRAFGDLEAGYFADSNSSGYASLGAGDYGILAYGADRGGDFASLNVGLEASGGSTGAYIFDSSSTGLARVGFGDIGIEAVGSEMGGHFKDADNSGFAYVGWADQGIRAFGNQLGGRFGDLNDSAFSYVAFGDTGIEAYGNFVGGYFKDLDSTAEAFVGGGNTGVQGFGSSAGGYFENTANGNWVIVGGSSLPGLFAVNALGVNGGRFETFSGTYGYVGGNGGESTGGNGSKNFIQNHPHDKDKVIRYTSLEGDEVGTYTRGSGRLRDGTARIQLSESFQWVTNPDLGLTAHVTPRKASAGLFVEAVSTTELIVRGPTGSDVAFDYIVHGLRIGFEEQSVVTDKTTESMIPAMQADRELYARQPQLRAYTARARFENMTAQVRGRAVADHSRAADLEAAVGRYDPAIHGPVSNLRGFSRPPESAATPSRYGATGDRAGEAPPSKSATPMASVTSSAERIIPRVATPHAPVPSTADRLPVSAVVEAGDVLVLDPERPGSLRPGATAADPGVAGVATAEGTKDAPVALGGMALCKVDAGYGSIRVGDLLTVSPTPGHAMRANEALPGTILGKAVEPLDVGSGTILVLIAVR